MILCVNLNAAIDKTAVVPDFHLNGIHRPEKVIAFAGGKGCNVARAIRSLGGQSVVTGWVGGHAGRFIEENARSEGIATAFVHTQSESRTCLSILDPVNRTLTELYEPGNTVAPAEIVEWVDWFRRQISQYAAVTFSGSLPPGAPADCYARLIEIANTARVPTLLDSSGEALVLGMKARPALAKVNKTEFEELVGQRIETIEECEREALACSQQHATTVVISLGARGAVCARQNEVIRAQPPPVKVASAVGSGDSLLAGLALGIVQSLSLEEALRQGVAAGTANAMTIGAGIFAAEDYRQVLQDTVVLHIEAGV